MNCREASRTGHLTFRRGKFSSRRRRSRWLAAISALELTISLTVLTAPSALAADGPYIIDGVVPDSNSFANLPDAFGETCPTWSVLAPR